MNAEMDRIKKESALKQEQARMSEMSLEELKDENRQLRDKMALLEQERVNLLNDKDR